MISRGERLLVYEYMPLGLGSVDKLLFQDVCILTTFTSRAAKALAFLHGAEKPVISLCCCFQAEIRYLGQLQNHPNFVKLIGQCCEDVCILTTFTSRVKMKVALGAAKALAFLHGAEKPVIYWDFKTANIMLDADSNTKLSDFGLARDGPVGDETHVSTRVMGSEGYAAPEYVMTGHLTTKCDVYSFGVVLLELLVGKRVIDRRRAFDEVNLVPWAYPLLNNHNLERILDPRLGRLYTLQSVRKVANLTYRCLCKNPKDRPTMDEVVGILESVSDLTWVLKELDHSATFGGGPIEISDQYFDLTVEISMAEIEISVRDS